jgi:hypothetical protein
MIESSDANTLDYSFSIGEVCLLDCLHNARHELRQLMQRFDDSLTLENLSFVEDYIKGRLSLLCDLEIGLNRYHINLTALSYSKAKVKTITPIIFGVYPDKSNDIGNGDQQLMFVHDVKIVKSTQGFIPSLVRLYRIDDKFYDGGVRSLYFSAVDGFYKFVSCVSKGELRLPVRCASSQGDNLTGHQVQGRMQVVDRISNNQGNLPRHIIGSFELKDILSILRVYLDVKTIEVRLEKCEENALKLIDVLIGPFDL